MALSLAAALGAALAAVAHAQPIMSAEVGESLHAMGHDHGEQLFVESTANGGPEQLFVALGATPDAISFSWLTNATGATSLVRWGLSSGALTNSVTGAPGKSFTCGAYTSGAVHTVNATGLPLATRIFYTVGDDATASRASAPSPPRPAPAPPTRTRSASWATPARRTTPTRPSGTSPATRASIASLSLAT
jgi:hypothetical protein